MQFVRVAPGAHDESSIIFVVESSKFQAPTSREFSSFNIQNKGALHIWSLGN
jgi:hypothetical protein